MTMKEFPLRRCAVFMLIALVGFALDLATKSWMFARLGMPGRGAKNIWWLGDGVFGFQTSTNQGALFGIGQGLVPLFATLSILAVIGIFIWLFSGKAAHDWLLVIALACITAGIFGNLYDRLGLPGLMSDGPDGHPARLYAVRDFILVMIGRWAWPNFNLADSFLVCGGGMLVWHALWHKPQLAAEQPAAEQETVVHPAN
jgi:signal peptidase II